MIHMPSIAKYFTISAVFIATALLDVGAAFASDWSEPLTIMRRRQGTIISYRAKVDSGYLVIEATHGKGWHTYSMDNLQRAQKKTGKEKPDTELPTRIEVAGGLKVTGKWVQSTPKDLSMTEIKWYTWGFEDTAYFAVPVEKIGAEDVTVTVSAQACNASSCNMVDGQTITIAASEISSETPAEHPPLPDDSYVTVGDPKGFGDL